MDLLKKVEHLHQSFYRKGCSFDRIVVWALISLVGITLSACGGGFDSTGILSDLKGSYGELPFSEQELALKLAAENFDPSLLPATEAELKEQAEECRGGSSFASAGLIARYLGLGRSNSIYGTLMDLCNSHAPTAVVFWLPDGGNEIKSRELTPSRIGQLRIRGKNYPIYLFGQQLSEEAGQGVFWISINSNGDDSGQLELVGARTPYFYQIFEADEVPEELSSSELREWDSKSETDTDTEIEIDSDPDLDLEI